MVKPIAKFSFMEQWKEYKLSDILSIVSGFAYKGEYLGKGESLLLGMGCVSYSELFLEKGMRPYAGEFPERYSVEAGDIVLATRQQSDNLPILGMPAIVPQKFKGKKMVFGANLYKVVPKSPEFPIDYIYWLLKTPAYIRHIRSCQTGTTVRMITKANIEDYAFMCPCKEQRNQISKLLWDIEMKIVLNRRINDNLEQQAQALFKSWFVDFEPFKDGEFVDSELGMIPKGWRVVCLGEVTKQVTEKVGNREDVTVLSPVNSGELVLSEEYFTKQVFSKNLSKYLIVNPLSFAYNPARINIGSIGLNEYDFVGCVSPVYVVFKCEPNYHYFFDFYKRTAVFKDEVALRAIGGVRQSLGYDDFSLIKTIYPTPDVVAEFNNLYLKMKEVITRNDIQNNKLTTLRDSLLPKLMSGELKINNFNR